MYNETQTSTAEARRLKKRELDRKAQRLARERTKSRIAQLESMVDNLRQDDSNAQIATLMDQLGKGQFITGPRFSRLHDPSAHWRYHQRHLHERATIRVKVRVASLCWTITITVTITVANTKRANSPNHDPKSSVGNKQLYNTRTSHQPPSPARPLLLRRLELRRDDRALPNLHGLRQLDPPSRRQRLHPHPASPPKPPPNTRRGRRHHPQGPRALPLLQPDELRLGLPRCQAQHLARNKRSPRQAHKALRRRDGHRGVQR
ncbi:hypothetical protein LB505_013352 [Fusarium chuoi]|nr:hypothetical protein LB505_013352 [Fusarium chuoi]